MKIRKCKRARSEHVLHYFYKIGLFEGKKSSGFRPAQFIPFAIPFEYELFLHADNALAFFHVEEKLKARYQIDFNKIKRIEFKKINESHGLYVKQIKNRVGSRQNIL